MCTVPSRCAARAGRDKAMYVREKNEVQKLLNSGGSFAWRLVVFFRDVGRTFLPPCVKASPNILEGHLVIVRLLGQNRLA